jgi:hypothetical protein
MKVEQARKNLDTMGYDWLALAVRRLGGPDQAVHQIGISRSTLEKWLEDGLTTAPFGKVVRISELAHVSLECLKRRLGAFPQVEWMEAYRVIERARTRAVVA